MDFYTEVKLLKDAYCPYFANGMTIKCDYGGAEEDFSAKAWIYEK